MLNNVTSFVFVMPYGHWIFLWLLFYHQNIDWLYLVDSFMCRWIFFPSSIAYGNVFQSLPQMCFVFGQTRQDMATMQPGLNDKTWMMIIKVYQVNVSLPLASKTHPFVENPHTLEQIFRFCLLFDVVLTFWWFDKYFCLQCWQINRRLWDAFYHCDS